jgi:hypothetical protein
MASEMPTAEESEASISRKLEVSSSTAIEPESEVDEESCESEESDIDSEFDSVVNTSISLVCVSETPSAPESIVSILTIVSTE